MKMKDVTHPVVFHHWQDGVQTDFAVGMMVDHPKITALEIGLAPVDRKFAKWMITERGIEQHRILKLLSLDPDTFPPVLFAHWIKDDSHLLIDGSHRYVVTAMKPRDLIKARIIPEPIWREFVIEDFPHLDQKSTINSFSGIL